MVGRAGTPKPSAVPTPRPALVREFSPVESGFVGAGVDVGGCGIRGEDDVVEAGTIGVEEWMSCLRKDLVLKS